MGQMINGAEAPLLLQHPHPMAAPLTVHESILKIGALATESTARPFERIAAERFELLDSLGLGSTQNLERGDALRRIERSVDDLAGGALNHALETFRRLLDGRASQEPPVVLWAEGLNPRSVIGRTLFWADHYLIDDRMADLAIRGVEDPRRWLECLRSVAEVRPLLELGLAVPVHEEFGKALTGPIVGEMVRELLHDEQFVSWVQGQIQLEGPTAREVMFVHVRDGDLHGKMFYLLNRSGETKETGEGRLRFTGKLFNDYDPRHDYEPWKRTVLNQATATLVQATQLRAETARALGGTLAAQNLFEARLLARLSQRTTNPDELVAPSVWADVPWLPGADAVTLARIAKDEAAVHDLRVRTSKALQDIESGDLDGNIRQVENLAAELQESANRLKKQIARNSRRNATMGAIAVGGVFLSGAPSGTLLAAAAAAAAVNGAIPFIEARREARGTAPYAFWMRRPK